MPKLKRKVFVGKHASGWYGWNVLIKVGRHPYDSEASSDVEYERKSHARAAGNAVMSALKALDRKAK